MNHLINFAQKPSDVGHGPKQHATISITKIILPIMIGLHILATEPHFIMTETIMAGMFGIPYSNNNIGNIFAYLQIPSIILIEPILNHLSWSSTC